MYLGQLDSHLLCVKFSSYVTLQIGLNSQLINLLIYASPHPPFTTFNATYQCNTHKSYADDID